MAAIGNTLGMIPCTGSDDSSFLFFFCQASKCSASPSDLETSDFLKIFSFKINFGVVFFRKESGLGQRSMFYNSFAFSIRLINCIGRDKFRAMLTIQNFGSVDLCHDVEDSIKIYKDLYN